MAVFQVQADLKTLTEFNGSNYVQILDKRFRQLSLVKRDYVVYANILAINKETEKAVCFDVVKDEGMKAKVWLPKSIIEKSKIDKKGSLVLPSYMITNLLE